MKDDVLARHRGSRKRKRGSKRKKEEAREKETEGIADTKIK